MSMIASYNLEVKGFKESQREKLDEAIEKMDVFDDGDLDDGFFAQLTWYDDKKEMCALSARFPDVLFTLDVKGEDYDGLDRYYFKGGRYQDGCVEIKYLPFDPQKLKDFSG